MTMILESLCVLGYLGYAWPIVYKIDIKNNLFIFFDRKYKK